MKFPSLEPYRTGGTDEAPEFAIPLPSTPGGRTWRQPCYLVVMLIETACRAIRETKILELGYDGYGRAVEVHACGYTPQGHAVVRAWQVRGGRVSRERQGWKLLRLDEAMAAQLSDQASAAPRKGFKPGDPAMARILCEVSLRR